VDRPECRSCQPSTHSVTWGLHYDVQWRSPVGIWLSQSQHWSRSWDQLTGRKDRVKQLLPLNKQSWGRHCIGKHDYLFCCCPMTLKSFVHLAIVEYNLHKATILNYIGDSTQRIDWSVDVSHQTTTLLRFLRLFFSSFASSSSPFLSSFSSSSYSFSCSSSSICNCHHSMLFHLLTKCITNFAVCFRFAQRIYTCLWSVILRPLYTFTEWNKSRCIGFQGM
jgi:hypothetical protein